MSAPVPAGWLRGGWMLTYTGRQFWPTSPSVEDVDSTDIAHALSLQCRYNGHVSRFYSVAEHCVLVSQAVPEEFALWGLLHDAAEAYVGDLIRPIKRDLPAYCAIEDRVLAVVAMAFGIRAPYRIPAAVHEADARILLTERAALLNLNGHRWDEYVESLEPLDVEVLGLSPAEAETAYTDRLIELLGGRS